jgi:hypothetical protein
LPRPRHSRNYSSICAAQRITLQAAEDGNRAPNSANVTISRERIHQSDNATIQKVRRAVRLDPCCGAQRFGTAREEDRTHAEPGSLRISPDQPRPSLRLDWFLERRYSGWRRRHQRQHALRKLSERKPSTRVPVRREMERCCGTRQCMSVPGRNVRKGSVDAIEKLAEDRVLICATGDDGRLVNGLGAVNLV